MEPLLTELAWELTVLSRAVAYQNLSGAALHIGMSQPQLSRIVARLEQRIGGPLLDRTARRKSGWTPLAHRLAKTYLRSAQALQTEIQHLVGMEHPSRLVIGTLEGLAPLAISVAHRCFNESPITTIELNIHDLNLLEELFVKGELNVLFSSREPAQRKFRYRQLLGYQTVALTNRGAEATRVFSSHEFETQRTKLKPGGSPCLISNSLAVRKAWLAQHGGQGIVPGPVTAPSRKPGGEGVGSVFVFASDSTSESFWKQLCRFATQAVTEVAPRAEAGPEE